MTSDFPVTLISRGARAAIHSYFDICPESPDGRKIAYFAMTGVTATPAASSASGATYPALYPGEIRVVDRATGGDRSVAAGIWGNRHVGPRVQWTDNSTASYCMTEGDRAWTIGVSDIGDQQWRLPGALRMANPCRPLGVTSSHESRVMGTIAHDEVISLMDFTTGQARNLFDRNAILSVHPMRDLLMIAPEQTNIKHTKWSPDGQRLFWVFHNEVAIKEGKRDLPRLKSLMVCDTDGSNLRYVGEFGFHPFWSGDSMSIWAFERVSGGHPDILAYPIDGGDSTVVAQDIPGSHASLSPDGSRLAIDCFDWPVKGQNAVVVMDTQTGRRTTVAVFHYRSNVPQHGGCHPHPVWSRDGRRVYFNADETGEPQLYAVESPA